MEVRHKGTRIILDTGLPLELDLKNRRVADDASDGDKPRVPGLYYDDDSPSPDALLFSHSHPDHSGLLRHVKREIPIGMSKGMLALMKVMQPFPNGASLSGRHVIPLDDDNPVNIGQMEVTPFLADHSGFDARSLQLTCGDKTILYTGDLRGHGRKSVALDLMLRRAKKSPDLLLMEGTTLGRDPKPGAPTTESELCQILTQRFSEHQGLALAAHSSQDMDRLVSFFKAALGSKRTLVLDVYGAIILEALADWSTLPQLGWNNLKVWYPQRVCRWLEHLGFKNKLAEYRKFGISSRKFMEHPEKYVVCFRDSMLGDIRDWPILNGAKLFYSMWDGYLESPGWQAVNQVIGDERIEHTHVSGHASHEALQKIVKTLSPKCITPIHTQHPEIYAELWDSVQCSDDGEVLRV